MKWFALGLILVVVFLIFRRMNRDTKIAFWQQRPETPFDDFYTQFYSNSGLDREGVRMALHMIARATDVPATRILPNDRINDLKPGALDSALAMLQRVLDTGLAHAAGLQQPATWKADTVDDVVRLLAPYYSHLKVTAD